MSNPSELFEALVSNNFIFGCCTACTTESIKKYGLYNEKYPMNLYLLRKGINIAFMDRVVIRYRSGGTSSPIRYNSEYRNDMNLIFKNEIIPYTNKKVNALKLHIQWKLRQKNNKQFINQYLLWKRYPLFLPVLVMLHPIRAFQKIYRTVKDKYMF